MHFESETAPYILYGVLNALCLCLYMIDHILDIQLA